MKKLIFRWLKIFILIYCGAGIALYYLQDKFLFHPVKLNASDSFSFANKHEEYLIPVNETDSISIVQFFSQQEPSKGAVVYYHGNRENINHYAEFASNFTKNGYDVWMMDYPGFGKSTGELNEENLYGYAKQAYRFVTAKYASDSIIIYGKSLGTGIAAYVAANNKCKRLILETPYYSIPKLAQHYFFMYPFSQMVHYKIPTFHYLEDVRYPITIFHGTDDGTVPFAHSKQLSQLFKQGDELISIENGEHNNLNDFKYFHEKLDSLLKL